MGTETPSPERRGVHPSVTETFRAWDLRERAVKTLLCVGLVVSASVLERGRRVYILGHVNFAAVKTILKSIEGVFVAKGRRECVPGLWAAGRHRVCVPIRRRYRFRIVRGYSLRARALSFCSARFCGGRRWGLARPACAAHGLGVSVHARTAALTHPHLAVVRSSCSVLSFRLPDLGGPFPT